MLSVELAAALLRTFPDPFDPATAVVDMLRSHGTSVSSSPVVNYA